MKIYFEVSGGYGGIRLAGRRPVQPIDTDGLPSDLEKEIRELVESSGVMELQQDALPPRSPQVRDALEYRLRLEDGDRSTSLVMDDTSVPPDLRPLLVLLQRLLKRKAKS